MTAQDAVAQVLASPTATAELLGTLAERIEGGDEVASGVITELVRAHGPEGATPAQVATAWVAQQPGVTTVIPGARSVDQARANAAAGSLPALAPELLDGVRRIYDEHLRPVVHHRW